jgi:hypothetical protein
MRCSTPHCPTERAEGSRFCAEHRDLLAGIAAEIDRGNYTLMKKTRRPRAKQCETDGCKEPPLPRESYCAAHLEEIERCL